MQDIRKNTDPSYLVHNNRVIADSGTLGNGFLSDRNATILKRGNLWNKCSMFYDGIDGKKVDSVNAVSKIYDLKGTNNLAQATAIKQPLVQAGGGIKFDGVDDVLAKIISSRAKVLELTDGGDLTFNWVGKLPQLGSSTYSMLFCFTRGTQNIIYFRGLGYTGGLLRLASTFACSDAAITTTTATATAIPYGPNDLLSLAWKYKASTGVVTGYINGVSVGDGNNIVGNVNDMDDDGTYTMQFNLYGATFGANTCSSCSMYKGLLTDAEIAYLDKNLRINKLSSIVSPDAQTFINRVELDGGDCYDVNKTEKIINDLKAQNLWDNTTLLYSAKCGIRAPLLAVNKLYCFKCADGLSDLAQTTAGYQPTYSNGGIVFDAVDDSLVKAGLTKAQILALTDNGDFTFQIAVKMPYGVLSSQNTLLYSFGDTNNRFYINKMHVAGNKIAIRFVTVINGTAVVSDTNSSNAIVYDENEIIQITVQYSASTGVVTSYINGVSMGNGVNNAGNLNNLIGDVFDIRLGRYSSVYGNCVIYGVAIFKGIISPTLAQLFI